MIGIIVGRIMAINIIDIITNESVRQMRKIFREQSWISSFNGRRYKSGNNKRK